MMTSAYGKRVAAWLGIIAMLLITCAPAISHWVNASRAVTVPVCSETQTPGHAHLVLSVSPGDHSADAGHGTGAHLLDDCGYCHLLKHDAVLPSVPAGWQPVLLLALLALVLPSLRAFTPIGAFPSGRPRAPPLFSHS